MGSLEQDRTPAPGGLRASRPWLCGAVVLICAVVLAGWAADCRPLKSVLPGMITMKVNTAVGLTLLAVALHGIGRPARAWRLAVPLALAAAAALAVATLAEYATGVDLRIDTLVFADRDSPRFPGRNAPATNAAFLGLTAALALLHCRRGVTVAQLLLAVVAAAPLATLGGYLYRAPGMYQDAPYPVIALNTSVALLLLCLGGLAARADEGLMGVVTSRSLAGSVARTLLPAAVGVPLLAGLAVLAGQRAGWYTAAFASALLVAACAAFFAGAVGWAATLLWRAESARAAAEAERARLLVAERDARADAERANRMKDEFLSVISHELRTPLNAILGWTQILQADCPGCPADDLADDLTEGLATIDRNARAQVRIIEDLLDMGRIVSGQLRLDRQRTDLSAVVRAALASVRPAAAARGVHLTGAHLNGVHPTPTDPSDPTPVDGDPSRLQQVAWNLLSNAIKFTPPGGDVRVSVATRDGHVELTVTDTGEGITPAFLPHVFDRFRQADGSTTRRYGGLGLGLAIVKQLVELHGGTAHVASPGPGRGTTFTVRLPPAPVATPVTAIAPAAAAPAPAPRPTLTGLRMLVVDDEADARTVLARVLTAAGAVVRTAASADAALVALAADVPDVLLSDIGMPAQNGYDLIRRVRQLPRDAGGAVAAVAVTAHVRAEDRVHALTAGFDHHVAKPIDRDQLIPLLLTAAAARAKTAARVAAVARAG